MLAKFSRFGDARSVTDAPSIAAFGSILTTRASAAAALSLLLSKLRRNGYFSLLFLILLLELVYFKCLLSRFFNLLQRPDLLQPQQLDSVLQQLLVGLHNLSLPLHDVVLLYQVLVVIVFVREKIVNIVGLLSLTVRRTFFFKSTLFFDC